MHWGLGGLAYIQCCFPLPFWDGSSVTQSLWSGALESSRSPLPRAHPITTPSEAGGRQAPPQGKAVGDSFSIDWNSKTRIAGQLREEGGPCTDHIFLVLEVRKPPQPHMHKKCSLEAKGELRQVMFHPYAFVIDSILAKRCVCTLSRIPRYTKYGLWTKQIKKIGQRKLGRNSP